MVPLRWIKEEKKMKYENYFKKNGKVYGVASAYSSRRWWHVVKVFYSLEDAECFLEDDKIVVALDEMQSRELMSRSKACKLAGKRAVEEAEALR